jgi:hypothetical protein
MCCVSAGGVAAPCDVQVRQIADIMLEDTRRRVATKGVTLEVGPRLMERIIQDGYSHEYGVRPLRQVKRQPTAAAAAAAAIVVTVAVTCCRLFGDPLILLCSDQSVPRSAVCSRQRAGQVRLAWLVGVTCSDLKMSPMSR